MSIKGECKRVISRPTVFIISTRFREMCEKALMRMLFASGYVYRVWTINSMLNSVKDA